MLSSDWNRNISISIRWQNFRDPLLQSLIYQDLSRSFMYCISKVSNLWTKEEHLPICSSTPMVKDNSSKFLRGISVSTKQDPMM